MLLNLIVHMLLSWYTWQILHRFHFHGGMHQNLLQKRLDEEGQSLFFLVNAAAGPAQTNVGRWVNNVLFNKDQACQTHSEALQCTDW